MNKVFVFLLLGLMVLGFVSGVEETISVIVMEGDAPMNRMAGMSVSSDAGIDVNVTHRYSSFNGYAAEVTAEELEELRESGAIVSVADREFSITLDVSVPKIGGDSSWDLVSSGMNITGASYSVCVIDTGVNYSHPSLGGCTTSEFVAGTCDKVVGGYDYINDDNDSMDDHGHGSHVAGIVASNDTTYRGVAPDAKIVSMKVLNATGGGGTDANVLAAIDWCVSNASKFNISVISMSLGDASTNNVYCTSGPWDTAITAARDAGIPVIISTGNCDVEGVQDSCTTGVSFPACLENATRVGATDDGDDISGFGSSGNGFMRGALFQLMAPGVDIMSVNRLGGFTSASGTSMSAPHVSGAIALIKQYLNLSSQTKTVDEIESVLNDTGVRLEDSAESGYNFSRINIYSALLSLDVDAPNVTLVSPVDNHVNSSVNYTFVCNATDWQLANVTLSVWNSTGLYYNESYNLTGTSNETNFSLTDMPEDDYEWNCLIYDNESNLGYASANYTLTIGGVEVELISPSNGSSSNVNLTYFVCNSSSDVDYELSNVTFELWNSTGDLINTSMQNISGVVNQTTFNYTFTYEDDYSWGCTVLNNVSYESNGISFSASYDATAPVISGLDEDEDETSVDIIWTTAGDPSNSSISVSGGSWSNSSSYVTDHSIDVTGLTEDTTYTYNVTSCDEAGNCDNDSGSFTTDAEAVVNNDGGSPGGSPSGGNNDDDETTVVTTVVINDTGYTKKLGEDDVVNFTVDSDSHTLTVVDVRNDSVEILIESDPIRANLSVGEEKKFNVSSVDYYDLAVKLNSISDGEANITMRKINESILVEERDFFATGEDGSEWDFSAASFGIGMLVGVVVVAVGGIVWIALHIKPKKGKRLKGKKRKKKNGKKSKKAEA